MSSVKAITVEHVTKTYWHRFQKRFIVDDLCLEIHRGEVFGFLGANGAGKTTTIKLILGLMAPSHGTITLFDKPASHARSRQSVSFLPDPPTLGSLATALPVPQDSALYSIPASLLTAYGCLLFLLRL